MTIRRAGTFILLIGAAAVGLAQAPRTGGQNPVGTQDIGTLPPTSSDQKWRAPSTTRPLAAAPAAAAPLVAGPAPVAPITPPNNQPAALTASAGSIRPTLPAIPRTPIAQVSEGNGNLPRDAGQVDRIYDISPYTARVTSTNQPEQALKDWILRETGYEMWNSEPFCFLSANRRSLRCYAPPETQKIVADMVDRFVNTEAESNVFGMRVITLNNPNWRTKAHRYLRPVPTQSQGIQAWLLHKEDASLVVAEMQKRTDFREHSPQHLLINNGQSKVISTLHTRNYSRDVIPRADVFPGYEVQTGQLSEGFNFEFSPLLSVDGKEVDAIIKCEVDLIENMLPVYIDVPTQNAPRSRQKIEVPQAIASRLLERFRWPSDQVLMISLGVGPTPTPTGKNQLPVNVPIISPSSRSDLLIFVDSKGKVSSQPGTLAPGSNRDAKTYRDRY